MDDALIGFLNWFGGILWGPWTFFVLLFAGLLFTVWTKFIQFRVMTHGLAVVRGVYDDPDDPGAISHFQALSAALSATIGLGNIGGVALAIGVGGPGALFWMWVVAILGMALKAVEITLAMLYRNVDDPEDPHGGAMWVIDKTLGARGGLFRPLAKGIGGFFCLTLIISTMTGGNMFQSWNVAELSETYFSIPQLATSGLFAVLVGLVIVGGIRRIGNVAGALVPFMSALYIIAGLAVVIKNIGEVPGVFALIFKSAFAPTEATGAFVGAGAYYAFTIGLKRALFSNEAGQGSAPIAHAAAKTAEPAREGVVGGLGPFIDTIVICTLTALVILTTGTWNRPAVGPTSAGTSFARVESTDTVSRWTFQGPRRVIDLPEIVNDDRWTIGDTLFMMARVDGAERVDGSGNRVRIDGEIVPLEGTDASSTIETVVEWKPIELPHEEWSAPPDRIALVDSGVYRVLAASPLTAYAFDRAFPGLGKWLITLAAWLFALSTMISWSYYGEQGVIYVFGRRGVLPYKVIFLALTAVAPLAAGNADELGALIDLGTGLMLWGNIPIVLGLGYLAVRSFRDYFEKLDAGEFKRFDGAGDPPES